MAYQIMKNELRDSFGKRLAYLQSNEVRDNFGKTICKIKFVSGQVEFADPNGRILGKLTKRSILDANNHEICDIDDAKSDFPHSDDSACAAFYLLFS